MKMEMFWITTTLIPFVFWHSRTSRHRSPPRESTSTRTLRSENHRRRRSRIRRSSRRCRSARPRRPSRHRLIRARELCNELFSRRSSCGRPRFRRYQTWLQRKEGVKEEMKKGDEKSLRRLASGDWIARVCEKIANDLLEESCLICNICLERFLAW